MERFPVEGLQVMIFGNLSRELFDSEIMMFIPISFLSQNFNEFLNKKVLYCDVAYEGLNNQEQYILENFEGEFTTSREDRSAKITNKRFTCC